MKKLKLFGLSVSVLLLLGAVPLYAQQEEEQLQKITLYSNIPFDKQKPSLQSSVRFEESDSVSNTGVGDLTYGMLRVGPEWDWFSVRVCNECRTVIKDLGKKKWSDTFKAPVLEPLPRLEPGQNRVISVDASGRDGANGANGADGANSVKADGFANNSLRNESSLDDMRSDPFDRVIEDKDKKKGQGIKTSKNFVIAKAGHIYLVRVVDNYRDFYILFRVEELKRGDSCTITWKKVPPPTK